MENYQRKTKFEEKADQIFFEFYRGDVNAFITIDKLKKLIFKEEHT